MSDVPDKYVRDLQREALEGDCSRIGELYRYGQSDRLPLVLTSDEDDAVIIKKNSIESHDVVGATGSSIVIVEGTCEHCGSNRLEKGHKEPAGVSYVACPVCNRDNMSSNREFNYSLGDE